MFRRNRVAVTLTCAAAAAVGVGVGIPVVTAAEREPAERELVSKDGFQWERAVDRRREARAKARAKARREAIRRKRAAVAVPPALKAIAQCESGANPKSVSSDGTYRGKYQFSRETWAAMGGKGDPAKAPEAVQDKLAIKLYNTSGPGQWPVCSR